MPNYFFKKIKNLSSTKLLKTDLKKKKNRNAEVDMQVHCESCLTMDPPHLSNTLPYTGGKQLIPAVQLASTLS